MVRDVRISMRPKWKVSTISLAGWARNSKTSEIPLWQQFEHSHKKRNSLDKRTVFIKYLEYVNNRSGRLLKGQIFFAELQALDGIEEI